MENNKCKLTQLKNVLLEMIFSYLDLSSILKVLPLQKRFLDKRKLNIKIYKLLYFMFSLSHPYESKPQKKRENNIFIELLKFPFFKNFLLKKFSLSEEELIKALSVYLGELKSLHYIFDSSFTVDTSQTVVDVLFPINYFWQIYQSNLDHIIKLTVNIPLYNLTDNNENDFIEFFKQRKFIDKLVIKHSRTTEKELLLLCKNINARIRKLCVLKEFSSNIYFNNPNVSKLAFLIDYFKASPNLLEIFHFSADENLMEYATIIELNLYSLKKLKVIVNFNRAKNNEINAFFAIFPKLQNLSRLSLSLQISSIQNNILPMISEMNSIKHLSLDISEQLFHKEYEKINQFLNSNNFKFDIKFNSLPLLYNKQLSNYYNEFNNYSELFLDIINFGGSMLNLNEKENIIEVNSIYEMIKKKKFINNLCLNFAESWDKYSFFINLIKECYNINSLTLKYGKGLYTSVLNVFKSNLVQNLQVLRIFTSDVSKITISSCGLNVFSLEIGTKFYEESFFRLADILTKHHNIKRICVKIDLLSNFNTNYVSDIWNNFPYFFKAIKQIEFSCVLPNGDLYNTMDNDKIFISFCKILQKMKHIECLTILYKGLDKNVNILSFSIKCLKSLKYLKLHSNEEINQSFCSQIIGSIDCFLNHLILNGKINDISIFKEIYKNKLLRRLCSLEINELIAENSKEDLHSMLEELKVLSKISLPKYSFIPSELSELSTIKLFSNIEKREENKKIVYLKNVYLNENSFD